jgi:hypothetical protein
MNSLKYLLVVICIVLTTACFKKDKPYTLPAAAGTTVVTIPLGTNYTHSCFYDLDSHDSLAFNDFNWDLALQCAPDSFHLFINAVNGVPYPTVLNMGTIDFAAVTWADTNNGRLSYPTAWQSDASSWRSDSTAFGTWYDSTGHSRHQVFVLMRGGPGIVGVRYRKLMLDRASNAYIITFANMDGTDQHTITVPKDITKNYMYVSLADSGHIYNQDQNKMDYDLLFTRGVHRYYNVRPIPLIYPLNGCMVNVGPTWVAIDTTGIFNTLTQANFNPNAFKYGNARDVIGGMGWKRYDFTAGRYVVNKNWVYIIKNKAGHYFKLHFIDFYDAFGNKGYPKFEYARLK